MDQRESDTNGRNSKLLTRQVCFRKNSQTPSASSSSSPKRFPSPNLRSSSPSTSTPPIPIRAVSCERSRPNTTAEAHMASNAIHNLNNSLQPDHKRARQISHMRERNKTPLEGNINSKLVESFNQHHWSTRTDATDKIKQDTSLSRPRNIAIAPSIRKKPMDCSTKPLETATISPPIKRISMDSTSLEPLETSPIAPSVRRLSIDGKINKPLQTFTVVPSLRRVSLEGTSNKPLFKSASDLLMQMSESGTEKHSLSSSSDRTPLVNSRPQSPTMSRVVSPSRARGVSPFSRGTSPSRVRLSIKNPDPILSFPADIKIGKKETGEVEDFHQLGLLYNRHLQWRFANAQTDHMMCSQKHEAEEKLYHMWRRNIGLLDSIRETRSGLRTLKFRLKLYSILEIQISILDEWSLMEGDHTKALTWAVQDLQDMTVGVPVTGGARADIRTVEAAVSYAIDVMCSMGAPVCSTLSEVEAMNSLVSKLADVAALERAKLVECESLLGSTEALQVEEYSLRTHLLQMIKASKNS